MGGPYAGAALRSALRAARISQAALARATGISTKHINQLTRDYVPLTVDVAVRIEEAVPAISAEQLLVMQVREQLATRRCQRSGPE